MGKDALVCLGGRVVLSGQRTHRGGQAQFHAALGNGPDDALVAGTAVRLLLFADPRPQPRLDRQVVRSHGRPQRTETTQGASDEALSGGRAAGSAGRGPSHRYGPGRTRDPAGDSRASQHRQVPCGWRREALGILAHRTGHFSRMRGSNQLEDCDVLLVVGTPAVRPGQVVRLARAYYHADPQVINETSERTEGGTWRYRDARMQRVADALVRAELTQCEHRNRPLRHDERIVVTLCEGLILDLPTTTKITSLPQLTPKGQPLALARRAAEQTRMTRAAAELEAHDEAVTSRALAATAHISLNTVCIWLRHRETGTADSGSVLSVLRVVLL